MSRKLLEKKVPSLGLNLPDLPIVDWSKIGHAAPEVVQVQYVGPDSPLPEADIVVVTWTTAEWSALDHVFVNSHRTRCSDEEGWKTLWHLYSLKIPETTAPDLWGFYRLVKIKNAAGTDIRVLLFKASCHLAHVPWITGLTEMVNAILTGSKAKKIYSIGTAGGATINEVLGDVAVTNATHIELQKPDNITVDYNNKNFDCTTWYPSFELIRRTEEHLFMPLSDVVTTDGLTKMIDKLHEQVQDSTPFTLKDLVNKPIDPVNLKKPRALACKDKPLLTTDFYFIGKATDSSAYCVLEMDDAVIARAAGLLNVDYAFVRNISDPLVADTATNGTAIPDDVREEWSSLIYETCGFYSSYNGALTTWAAIAG